MAQFLSTMFGRGTAFSAFSSIYGGISARSAANSQAKMMRFNANTMRAATQRRAEEKRHQARLVVSHARVVAGASGTQVYGDPGYEEMESILTAEGELQAMSLMWAGENQAIGKEQEAAVAKSQGVATLTAGFLTAGATLMTGYGIYKSDFDPDSTSAMRAMSNSGPYG